MVEPSVATETQSKTVATQTDPSETLATKDTFKECPEEYDEDEASSNKETKDEGRRNQ